MQFSVLGVTDESFMHYMTDTVVDIVCTLNGCNMFHGLGIIATITPEVNSSIIVP